MPVRDDDRIAETYRSVGTLTGTARALGLSRTVVHQAIRRANGQCPRCSSALEPGKSYCRPCLDKINAQTHERTAIRAAAGVCTQCAEALAPGSRLFCPAHLEDSRERLRASRARHSTGPKPVGGRRELADHAAILRTFEETGSIKETAERTGRPYPTIHQIVSETPGTCRTCPNPRLPSKLYCRTCFRRIAEQRRAERQRLLRTGLCALCDNPIARPSRTRCADHRMDEAERHQRSTATHRRKSADERRHMALRRNYGEAGVQAWIRDGGRCVICNARSGEARICVHHIDCDHDHNVVENMALLCLACHQFLHQLLTLRDRHAALAWIRTTYPDLGV